MHEEVFRALENGATVITASGRLARALTLEFHQFQRRQARSVWGTPDILPLEAFLRRAWWEWVLRSTAPCPTLLSALQEQLVWEQVIRETAGAETLLRIPETARLAADTWKLVQAYRLPVDGRFEATEDWAAFAEWSRAFQKKCRANNWLEQARLSYVLAKSMERRSKIYIAGFDDTTPQQSEFFEAIGATEELQSGDFNSRPEHWKYRDASEEIRDAAVWARQRVEERPETQMGIIVPGLQQLRSKVERVFRAELGPAFHISLGSSLDQYPLARSALLMLEFGGARLTLPQSGMLLRSPFLAGASVEWTKRALLDAHLRRRGLWDVTLPHLRDASGNCPLLQEALRRFEQALQEVPEEQPASEWARDFSRLLEALGWPGDRTLSSSEFQVVEQWQTLLSSIATLDMVTGPMSFDQALARLREVAQATPFQVEDIGAPVQVMGSLEASGLRFDHMWIMGLHDEALPAAAAPNPFIPISFQRERNLPHCSADRELEFANGVLRRLIASAPEVVLSYPAAEADRALSPSPLIGSVEWTTRTPELPIAGSPPNFEELSDENAPAVAAESMQPGGASLFKDMAACHFRAFAKHRLGARRLEETTLGLSYSERGMGVHKALELIWTELGSHAALVELTADALGLLLARHVNTAVQHLNGIGRKLEQRRLEKLLGEWLEIEKSRAPFIVRTPEQERVVSLGGLQVRTRADRIDQLPAGGEIILDYKTGVVKSQGWEGERPDEPQLPLYCATSERPIVGAAFAIIRTGELAFKGLTESGVALPALKKMSLEEPLSFQERAAEWERVLERLAKDYRSGLAVVNPKHGACDYCGLQGLCRVRELDNVRG